MFETNNETNIELDVYRSLTKTFILLDDCDRQFFAAFGLSTRQFWALAHLDEEQGCSMVDLSRVLFTDKSNITGIVDRLERLNLVTRTPASHDRRVILIRLTAEGRLLHDKVNEQHEALIRDLMQVVSKDKLGSLLDSLGVLSHNLEEYLEQADHNTSVA
jgi:DNA-binding MarR family transcriptional regulator